MNQSQEKMRCGFITIIGRPNVGKSTLLNNLLGKKISITSCKAKTTHHSIAGIRTEGLYQAIYIDTPGFCIKKNHLLDRLINQVTSNSISNAELIIFVVEGTFWTLEDEIVLNKLRNNKIPVILAINKVDNVKKKSNLLSHLRWLDNQMDFLDIVILSAKTGLHVNTISDIVHNHLPEAIHRFPDGYITNCSQKFIASEIIREKLIRFLGAELPYSVTVEIEYFQIKERGNYSINGLILVEREGQKKIVIGEKGSKIRSIGIEARKDIQIIFENTVHLGLWVKVKSGWNNNEHILRNLGYGKIVI